MIRLVKTAGIIGLCATPLLLQGARMSGAPLWVSVALLMCQFGVLAWLLTPGSRTRKATLALAAVAAIAGVAWRFGAAGLEISSGLPHFSIFLALLIVFATTLLNGPEPFVTGIIRRVRGPLPDELISYGETLTRAWCVFFAAQLAVSLVLFVAAPRPLWSFFINVLSFPLVLAMFAGEYVVRRVRFRHLAQSRARDMITAIRTWRTDPAVAEPVHGAE